jgi:hypothetical protein
VPALVSEFCRFALALRLAGNVVMFAPAPKSWRRLGFVTGASQL